MLRLHVVVSPQQVVQFVVDAHDDVAVGIVDNATVPNDSVLAEHDFPAVERQDVLSGLRDDQATSAPGAITAGCLRKLELIAG